MFAEPSAYLTDSIERPIADAVPAMNDNIAGLITVVDEFRRSGPFRPRA
jgi:hypothetical protein